MIKPFAWQLPFPRSNVAHYFLQSNKEEHVATLCGLNVNTKEAVLAPKSRKCELCLDAIGENQ